MGEEALEVGDRPGVWVLLLGNILLMRCKVELSLRGQFLQTGLWAVLESLMSLNKDTQMVVEEEVSGVVKEDRSFG